VVVVELALLELTEPEAEAQDLQVLVELEFPQTSTERQLFELVVVVLEDTTDSAHRELAVLVVVELVEALVSMVITEL
jgi:hypothetical protein